MSVSFRLWVRGAAAACALALPAVAAAQLPNTYNTPGATTKANAKEICAADYATSQKPASGWQKTTALERYGIRPETFSGDLDHLVPVALGGSNDPDNLWPMRGKDEFTPAAKAQLAERLKQMVCDGKLSLKDAQNAFKKDWTKTYKQYSQALNAPGGGQ
jgi:hypothetical protein